MAQLIFCVGNLAKQEFIINGEPQILFSGSAAYTSIATKISDVEVLLISSIGKDFPQDWLEMLIDKGIRLKIKKEDAPSILLNI